ncbi:MAG TPA: dipeptide epimerase [Chitinophagaceae bacterium]|nr:dipeptide epimerase [Chitinophagaceae bacterium]
MICSYFPFDLEFRYPFTISRGTKTHQPTLVVELDFHGIKGYGEAPAISFYDITVEKMIADLEQKKPFIEKFALTDPGRYWHYLHHLIPNNNFLVCALDMAAWDIYGKMNRKPLFGLWEQDTSTAPVTDYTIGIDRIEKMVEKMKEKPWPVYKIKLGTSEDMSIMRALRQHTDALFRVDANAGWTTEEALEKIPELKDLGVQFIEQPLAKDNWEGMRRLFHESVLPLIADESCVVESDVDKCHRFFHGINIKLTKCSGITPARRMIARARELEMEVMIGSMNESTIGSAAIAHLAPMADYLDMDGPLLLKEDLATGIGFNAADTGRIIYSGKPGLGIEYTGKTSSPPVSQS